MSTAEQPSSSLGRESLADFLDRPGAVSWLARAVLPETEVVDLPGLGHLVLRPVGLDHDTAERLLGDVRGACEVFVMPSMGPGLLMVERRLAQHLVHLVLRVRTPEIVVPLSRIERGMLGGLAAGILSQLGLVRAITLTEGDQPAPNLVAVEVLTEIGGRTGHVWLCAAPLAFERAWEVTQKSFGGRPAVLHLELARTEIPRAEALAVSEGDVVVFDETAALFRSSSWHVQVNYRGWRAQATLAPDGRVCAAARVPPIPVESRSSKAVPGGVEIVAEIGYLSDGHPAAKRRAAHSDGILLRMDEADWVEGALCEVAGRLAVEVMRKLAG